ncbi:MAG: hypothetical protein ABI082_13645 [Dokdonella sp.]
MLIAPLTLPVISASPLHRPFIDACRTPSPAADTRVALPAMWTSVFVGVWLVAGIACLMTVPAARGSALLGATLPFWLVVAPALDFAWLQRAAIVRALRRRSLSVQTRLSVARARRPRRQWRR